MPNLEHNEIRIIPGGDLATQIRDYYNDVNQGYKLSFLLGGATASLGCIIVLLS